MNSYQDFLTNIKAKTIPTNLYYEALVKFTKDILVDIAMRNQHRVAQDLGMTPVKLSHLLPLLKVLLENRAK